MQKSPKRVKKQLQPNFPTSIMNLRAAAIMFMIDLALACWALSCSKITVCSMLYT